MIKAKENGASAQETFNFINGSIHDAYDEDPEKGVDLVIEYLKIFRDKKNYKGFPYGPIFLTLSTNRSDRSAPFDAPMAFLLKFHPALRKTVHYMFVATGSDQERRRGFINGVATKKLKKDIAQALREDFTPKEEAPPGTMWVTFGGQRMLVALPKDK
jgi:hypothetical protein